MKALLPVFCRPLGYIVLVIALFLFLTLYLLGMINDINLPFYKECTKLLLMAGSLMILLALTKDESIKTEQIRIIAIRRAVFITLIFIFGNMLYRVATKNISVDSTSFLIFMIINVLCLEFGFAKAKIDIIFKR